MTRSIFVLLVLFVSQEALAQTFEIDEFHPSDGAAGVELQTAVRFEFNDAVDQQTDLNRAFMIIPRTAVRISKVDLVPDEPQRDCPSVPEGRICPSVIEYSVTHEPETDYTWLAYAVQTIDGQAMTSPFVLRYTTSSTIGEYRIGGEVDAPTAKRTSASAARREVLGRLMRQIERQGLGSPAFEVEPASPFSSSKKSGSQASKASAVDPHTVVLLVDNFTVSDAAWQIRSATVLQGVSGSFELEYIRPGTYYPLAVHYADGSRREIVALGYYDPNGDDEPDPVTVTSENVSGVSLSMHPFELTTSSGYLSVARDSAMAIADDQMLLGVRAAAGARPAGTAYVWTYYFYSAQTDLQTLVRVDPLDVTVSTSTASTVLDSYPVIPTPFVTSEEALQKVLDDGGRDFLDAFSPENINTVIQGGHVYFKEESLVDPYWQVHFSAITSSTMQTFSRLVNMRTGDITATSVESPETVPDAAVLAAPYPNPFSGVAHIPLRLPEATDVKLVVFDALGRQVTTLLDQAAMPAGRHTATWQPHNLPSGFYVLRLQTGTQTESRVLTLLK